MSQANVAKLVILRLSLSIPHRRIRNEGIVSGRDDKHIIWASHNFLMFLLGESLWTLNNTSDTGVVVQNMDVRVWLDSDDTSITSGR